MINTLVSVSEAPQSHRTATSTATVRSCPATRRIDWRKVNPRPCNVTPSIRRAATRAASLPSSSFKTKTKWIWTQSRTRIALRYRKNPIWVILHRRSRPTMSRAITTRSRQAWRKIDSATAERAWTVSRLLRIRFRCSPPRRHRPLRRSGNEEDGTICRATTSTDPLGRFDLPKKSSTRFRESDQQ